MASPVVEASELTKVYNGATAVDRLSLQIGEGEIFGFLGPNGAGKTTTILMLLGLTEPTSGVARVYGHDSAREPMKVKRVTGYLPENVGFYEDLTARQNLAYIARLNGISGKEARQKIEGALDAVGLSEVASKEVGKFSKGMKQRLGIADVLIKNPRLVIMDEPTTGIDPAGVTHILDLIVNMAKQQGITIMLSSHLLYQVQKICDRVGIIAQGRLVAEGSIQDLGRRMTSEGQNVIEVEVDRLSSGLMESVGRVAGVKNVDSVGSLLTIRSDRDVRAGVSKAIVESGALTLGMKSHDYALEEIYLKYFTEV
ncbi:MAG: ABC transporter ATP-binding protein [Chloroflexi bacterium]|nr:ABC transporter ATP-binding protein [Chloroflexota bacterium]